MTDSTPFKEVADKAYGWLIDEEGFLWGLVAGDQGYEKTDMKFSDLIGTALANEEKRFYQTGNKEWPINTAWFNLMELARKEVE